MQNTVSGRDLQRTPKRIMDQANKLDKPLVVITENKPVGAIIGLNLLRMLNAVLDHMNKAPFVDEETDKRIKVAIKDLKEGRYTDVNPEDEKALNKILGI